MAGRLQWEYTWVDRLLPFETASPSIEDIEECNRLGKEGWEMLSVVREGDFLRFWFKRPIRPDQGTR